MPDLADKDLFKLHHFIVHEVLWNERPGGTKLAQVNDRENENTINAKTIQMAKDVGALFNQTSLAAGIFASEKSPDDDQPEKNPTYFESQLVESFIGDSKFSDFAGFTKRCTLDFANNFFGKAKNATPGYLLFFQHSYNEKHFLSVVMLHKTKGMTLSDDLELTENEQLDLSTLHLAARICLTVWKSEDRIDERYIRFKTGLKNFRGERIFC